MKKYELLLVLPGTLDEKESETRSNEILSLIKESDNAAEIAVIGKMRLAYPIKQIRYGYYYTIIFNVESKALKTIQEKLGLMRDLLRAIVSIYNPNYNPAQKLSYTASSVGVAAMNEENTVSEAEKTVVKPATKPLDVKVSIQDIDKKLDEILAGEIISGV